MRIQKVLLIVSLCLALPNLQAVTIDIWQTFPQSMSSDWDGQREMRAALELIEQKKPAENQAAILESLKIAQNKGHPCADLLLGMQERDPKKKIALLRTAFDKRLQPAIYELANALYRHGRGKEADFPEAFKLFIRANQWPNKNTLFYIGRMYHLGHGTKIDYVAARSYYKRAVDAGSIRAANNLANLWAEGKGGEANLPMALSYLNYASERGMAMASYNLGQKYRTQVKNAPDYTNALKYYQRAVEQAKEAGWDDAAAAYWVGWIYLYGKGVPIDVERARPYLETAAEGEFTRAYFTLGWFYDSGKAGVPDLRTANEYYRKAAEKGHSQAQSNLAWNLWQLNGPQGMAEAEPYFRQAIAQGNIEAMCNFGFLNLWEKWPGADPSYGLELTLQSAEAENRQAIENLIYYYKGNAGLIQPIPEKVDYWQQKLHTLKD